MELNSDCGKHAYIINILEFKYICHSIKPFYLFYILRATMYIIIQAEGLSKIQTNLHAR